MCTVKKYFYLWLFQINIYFCFPHFGKKHRFPSCIVKILSFCPLEKNNLFQHTMRKRWPVFPCVTNYREDAMSTKLSHNDSYPWFRYDDTSPWDAWATYAALGTLFLNKVGLLAQCQALTKVSRQCIREGRLDSPLIPLPFENPFRPRLTNTSATFRFDYLIPASWTNLKKGSRAD